MLPKVAVVTGGASGIGRRTVERLLAGDWDVWSIDLSDNPDDARFSPDIAHRYHSLTCAVSSPDSVARTFRTIENRTDRIRALICCVGVAIPGDLERVTPAPFDTMIGVNVKGPWLCVREALPLLRCASIPDDPARVVIVGSIGGIRPKAGNGVYSATKAAVHVLTGIFAVELAASGVIVNAVAPGTVNTPMIEAVRRAASPDAPFGFSGESPLGRIAEPDDIADAILYFLSDAARYVNGAVLPVDGGDPRGVRESLAVLSRRHAKHLGEPRVPPRDGTQAFTLLASCPTPRISWPRRGRSRPSTSTRAG